MGKLWHLNQAQLVLRGLICGKKIPTSSHPHPVICVFFLARQRHSNPLLSSICSQQTGVELAVFRDALLHRAVLTPNFFDLLSFSAWTNLLWPLSVTRRFHTHYCGSLDLFLFLYKLSVLVCENPRRSVCSWLVPHFFFSVPCVVIISLPFLSHLIRKATPCELHESQLLTFCLHATTSGFTFCPYMFEAHRLDVVVVCGHVRSLPVAQR